MEKKVLISNNISVKGEVVDASSKTLENFRPIINAEIVGRLKNNNIEIEIEEFKSEFGLSKDANKNILKRLKEENYYAAIIGENGLNITEGLNDEGIYALNPSYGKFSRYGIYAYAGSMDSITIYADDLEKIDDILEIISGRDNKDFNTANICECKNGGECKCSEGCKCHKEDETKCTCRCGCDHNHEDFVSFGIFEELGINEKILNISTNVLDILSFAEATTNLAAIDGIRYGKREEGKTYDEIIKNSRTNFGLDVKENLIFGSYILRKENLEEIYFKAMKIRREIVEELKDIIDEADYIVFRKNKVEGSDKEKEEIKANFLSMVILSGMPFVSFKHKDEEYIIAGDNFDEEGLLEFTKDILEEESLLDYEEEIEEEEDEK